MLSEHPEYQEKVRSEILKARQEAQHIPYDQLMELPFLDAIVRETLRLWVLELSRHYQILMHELQLPTGSLHPARVSILYASTRNEAALKMLLRTRKDTVLPISRPIQGLDGTQISEIVVPNNTSIVANTRQCNTDKELWGEDALRWKPERWLSPLPSTLTAARIPGIYSNMYAFSLVLCAYH